MVTKMAAGLIKLAVFCILASFCVTLCAAAEKVDVFVRGVTSIAKTDDDFICATVDWWPSSKCDYGQCPWGQAGILNLVFYSNSLFIVTTNFVLFN